jgi:hypothetical protein
MLVLAGVMVAVTARAQSLPPACNLMTQATAAAINGAPVSAGQEQDNLGAGNSCVFNGNGNPGTVTIGAGSPSMMGQTPPQMFKLGETQPMAGTKVTVLSGLGDGAYYSVSSLGFDVYVLKGNVILDVSAAQPQGPASGLQAAMVAAAKTALSKM